MRVVERKWQRDEEKLASEAGDMVTFFLSPRSLTGARFSNSRVVPLQFPEQLFVQKICTR